MSTVHDRLRRFEQEAVGVDTTYDSRDRTERDANYYRISNYNREGALPARNFWELLVEKEYMSESEARRLIKDAFDAGEVLRTGSGSATCYRTPERQEEIDQAARDLSAEMLALGARAKALGLRVDYELVQEYQSFDEDRALEKVAEGRLVKKVRLNMGLEALVTFLEEKADEGF